MDYGWGWMWPFGALFGAAWFVVMLIFLIIWILIIVDCAKRKFKNDAEKIIWLVVIVLGTWVGSLVYLIAITLYNKQGLMKK